MTETYPRIGGLGSVEALRARLRELRLTLPCDDAILPAASSPLAQPLHLSAQAKLNNRFVIQPMEGWDGTPDGYPTDLTTRRWQNFGRSGAAWIWGGEAVAVRADGRANPNQLLINQATASAIGGLRRALLAEANPAHPPLLGLQLTHSGRWARASRAPAPGAQASQHGRFHSDPAPRIAFRHPLLDRRVGIEDDRALLSDADASDLIRCFARAARLAQEEGFEFVDIKHCHGYLLHEFLAARSRVGLYGGASLDSRLHLTSEILAAVHAAAPRLTIAMRLSVFDFLPHHADGKSADGKLGPGAPDACTLPYVAAFGIDPTSPERSDLSEPIAMLQRMRDQGVTWINVTAGSPYYVPHIQRPALFPPSDGYAPPEDPLVGVHRLLHAARAIKAALPDVTIVSSGWSYLQEYIPHVAQACVREGWFDAVGLGRIVLSYPELPVDVLAGSKLQRKKLCRTFSDCTTAPRNGFVSGCYPLDPFYRARPERAEIEAIKRGIE